MSNTNLFEKAKETEVVKPKAKGKAKLRKDIAELDMYAAIQAATKALETMAETLKASINEEAMAIFVEKGTAESFQGVDGDTTASIQLRKRSAKSVLSEQERLVLDELGIATEKSNDSRFYINTKYSEDTDLLGKVSEALSGIVPDDFLGHTGDKYVTTSDSIRQAFEKGGDENILKIVGVQAARTKFGGTHAEMVAILDTILKSPVLKSVK